MARTSVVLAVLAGASALAAQDRLKIVYQDLPQAGLVFVTPKAPEYAGLLEEIEKTIARPIEGGPVFPSGYEPKIAPQDRDLAVILINRGPRDVAMLEVTWTVAVPSGKTARLGLGLGSGPYVFDLFTQAPVWTPARLHYWHTILAGSKRYIGGRSMVGNNSDVRLPTADEMLPTGMPDGVANGQYLFGGGPSEGVLTIAIDGVFFTDGGFAGPNENRTFESVKARSRAYFAIGRIAAQGQARGDKPADVLDAISVFTKPASQHFPGGSARGLRRQNTTEDDFFQMSLAVIEGIIERWRKVDGDAATAARLAAWNDVKLPEFHRQ